MKIALDAMGGDAGPGVVCEAAVDFLRKNTEAMLMLVGPEQEILGLLRDVDGGSEADRLEVKHAEDFIGPDDEPARAIRTKKASSMVRCLRALREGEADAMVSPGNTGALLVGSMMILGRTPGVERPALAVEFPSIWKGSTLLLDLGGTTDARARHLCDYAMMGITYAREVMDRAVPRFGLLNIGTEENKGDQLRLKTFPMFRDLAGAYDGCRFVGNVETRDLMNCPADVVVTDGFVGNMVLKTVEGMESALMEIISRAAMGSREASDEDASLRSLMESKLKQFDYRNYGGAALLGVRSMVIKCHGRSGRQAIANALDKAYRAAVTRVPDRIESSLSERSESV